MIYFCCWLLLSMHCHSCLLRGIIPDLYPLHNEASLHAGLSVILPTIMNLYWLQGLFPPALSLHCSLASASRIHNELLKSVTIPIISRTAALYNLCITISMQLRESPPAHPHPISATYCDQCPSFTYFSQLNWESHKTGRVLLIKMDCRVTQKNIFFWMVCIITPWCYWRWYFTWVTEFL